MRFFDIRFFISFLLIILFANNFCFAQGTPLKKATLVIWQSGEKNSVFQKDKNLLFLKTVFKKQGYDLNTHDITPPQESEIVLVARKNYSLSDSVKGRAFLWLLESPISIRVAKDPVIMERYDKIFTYHRELTDNEKYFYMPIPYNYKVTLEDFPTLSDKTVLVAQIASNNTNSSPLCIYNERREATRWFLENAPKDFVLYGPRWNRFEQELSPSLKKEFNQIYKGWVDNKLSVVKTAKFVLAYENAKFPGYISEKIFDAMAGGSVPVYLGAPDIADYVPKQCFINREEFSSYNELYDFLKNMPDDVYNSYLKCIKEFMTLPKHYNDSETVAPLFEKGDLFYRSFF